MRVKICGITKPEQGEAIVQLGATALGFICVPSSPRYVTPDRIQSITSTLPRHPLERAIDCVGVFVDASLDEMRQGVEMGLTAIQLHGQETLPFCQQIRAAFPDVELIKALRIRDAFGLQQALRYQDVVDTLLLDAYHPHLLGGTGQTLNWEGLQDFRPRCPWFLAGGLTPENIRAALSLVRPDGIDLSSGVELAPGDKDLHRVKHLFEQLQAWGNGVL